MVCVYLLYIPQALFQEHISPTTGNIGCWLLKLTADLSLGITLGNYPPPRGAASPQDYLAPPQGQLKSNVCKTKARPPWRQTPKGHPSPRAPIGSPSPSASPAFPTPLDRREHSLESSPKITEAEELGFKSKSTWLSALSFHQLYEALDFDIQNTNPYSFARHAKSLLIWQSFLASHPITHSHTTPGPVTPKSFLSMNVSRFCFLPGIVHCSHLLDDHLHLLQVSLQVSPPLWRISWPLSRVKISSLQVSTTGCVFPYCGDC